MIRWLLVAALVWVVWRLANRPRRAAREAEPRTAGGDPHAVLGIAPGASADEISRAYREQMKLYHPDRVADLGPEIQRVAHEKTLAIQRAYEELTRD